MEISLINFELAKLAYEVGFGEYILDSRHEAAAYGYSYRGLYSYDQIAYYEKYPDEKPKLIETSLNSTGFKGLYDFYSNGNEYGWAAYLVVPLSTLKDWLREQRQFDICVCWSDFNKTWVLKIFNIKLNELIAHNISYETYDSGLIHGLTNVLEILKNME